MKNIFLSCILVLGLFACGNKNQEQQLSANTPHIEQPLNPQTPENNTPQPTAPTFVENVELMQALKDHITNTNSLQELLDGKAPFNGTLYCGLPLDKKHVSYCGTLAKYETQDTIFVLAKDVEVTESRFETILLKLAPNGKELVPEKILDTQTAG